MAIVKVVAPGMRYNHKKIEDKWNKLWLKNGIYEPDFTPRQARGKKPFYNLMMFPYPSAEGLHIGAVRTFSGVDIYGRMKRMQGYDVFEPIGLDGFGIHSENYALKIGKHPIQHAKDSEKNFYRQLAMMGNGFSWNEKLETYDPKYYKWTQWIFVQLFKMGLAYRKKSVVNWCPSCLTVLADEQVIKKSKIKNQNAKLQLKIQKELNAETVVNVCERCETPVIKKDLEQWFFKITDYAERLLKNLEKLDWSEPVKIAQKNWIGKSEGALIKFQIFNSQFSIEVFTTRPDTLFGATYLVLAPEHQLISKIKNQISNIKEVENYIKVARTKTDEERIVDGKEKTGVELKGIKAVNPANNEEIPIWVADYVLGNVGTGAIMAVPAHDQRDFEFAKKFNLPIKMVVCPHYPAKTCPVLDSAYLGSGHLVASEKFSGMESKKARSEITKFVGGERKTNYRLRDWLVSRQRYWGPPIPIIYCHKCWENANRKSQSVKLRYGIDYTIFNGEEFMIHAVSEKDLPVKLPNIKNFRPTGTGTGPLGSVKSFYEVRCPNCGKKARRETDVSDAFLDSGWYYLGYLILGAQSAKRKAQNLTFPKDLTKKWLPVDMYIGGAEHSVLHLLYSRFIAMAFYDFGMLHFEEPFKVFRAHGLITKDGAKMSKSKGNVVNPDEYFKVYGADVMRMYLAFMAPLYQSGDFRDEGIIGMTRFLNRVFNLISNFQFQISNKIPNTKNPIQKKIHQTIKKVTEDIENLEYNTAISALMMLLNEFEHANSAPPPSGSGASAPMRIEYLEIFLKLLSPFAPYISEELYQQFFVSKKQIKSKKFSSIHLGPWPEYDPKLIEEETTTIIIQINGKMRDKFEVKKDLSGGELEEIIFGRGKIKNIVGDKAKIKKIIYVKNRLVNIVI